MFETEQLTGLAWQINSMILDLVEQQNNLNLEQKMKIEANVSVILIALILGTFLIACGSGEENETGISGSGLVADLYLDELSTDEKQTFCTWYVDAFGGEGKSHTCMMEGPDGQVKDANLDPIDIPTVEDCTSGDQFKNHCQLGDTEACFKATAGDPCKMAELEECRNINECVASQANAPDNACDEKTVQCFCTVRDCMSLSRGGMPVTPEGTIKMAECKGWWLFCSPRYCSGYEEGDYELACKDVGMCDRCDGGTCGCAF